MAGRARVLADPRRHKAGRPERYLLSGVARCAVCGGRIYGARELRGVPIYAEPAARRAPRRGRGAARGHDRSRPPRPTRRPRALLSGGQRDQAQGLREEEASLRARLDGLSEAFAEGEVDREQLRKGSERLRARLVTVTSTLASLAVTPAVADLVSSADVAQAWNELDLDRQRAVVDTLLTVVLHSPGRGARHFNPATGELTWK